MKKLILTLTIALMALGSWAQSFNIRDLQYWVISDKEKTVEVTGLSGELPNLLNIPETVTRDGIEYKVISIREGAFDKYRGENSENLKTIFIGDNVTELPKSFMSNMTQLATVHLGTGLKTIGAMAFLYCRSLESIVIPEGVETMSGSTFSGCTKLRSAKLPKSLNKIPPGIFYDCPSLEVIDFGSSKYDYMSSLFRGSYPNLMRIILRSVTPPEASASAFPADAVKNTYLHVPEGCAQAYKNNEAYKNFKGIIDDITDTQCADPEIIVSGGVVRFTCATPGVTFKYTATAEGSDGGSTSGTCKISEPHVFITVQATKSDREPSNTITKVVPCSSLFTPSGDRADVNSDGYINSADVVEIYNRITSGGH